MKKFGLEVKVVLAVILMALFISLIERYEMSNNIIKQFKESEQARNTLLLNTISPIISLNLSLGLFQANKEYLDEITKQNSDILELRILDNHDIVLYTYTKQSNATLTKEQNENYFHHNIIDNILETKIASIELFVSEDRYKKVLQNNTQTTIEIFFITFIILIIFIIALKREFSSLKKLSTNILIYDPKRNNFPLKKSEKFDEIGVIHNAIIGMVEKINLHTELLASLNDSLESKVKQRTHELIDTNNQLNEYKNNLESKVEIAIKEKEEANFLLAQQSKMASLGEMLASITHQWKQPLSVISAINLKLQVGSELKSITHKTVSQNAQGIENQLEYMTQTLKDFSEFFQPDKQMVKFSIRDAIDSIISLFGDEYKTNNIIININQKTSENTTTIFGYNNEFRQVVLNILSNAKYAILKTKASKKEINILLTSDEHNIYISIQDYAGGIDDSIKNKLFEPYITTKSKGDGTGIGLYMSKRIIEDSMDGKLEVENKNGGALFTITLPKENVHVL